MTLKISNYILNILVFNIYKIQMSAQQALEVAKEERSKIVQELNRIRDDVKKYEGMLKPKVFKPKEELQTGDNDAVLPKSEDSDSDSL